MISVYQSLSKAFSHSKFKIEKKHCRLAAYQAHASDAALVLSAVAFQRSLQSGQGQGCAAMMSVATASYTALADLMANAVSGDCSENRISRQAIKMEKPGASVRLRVPAT